MHTVLSMENFQHESDHVITITNNKRVILEIMTSIKLVQHTLPPVDQTWSTGWVRAQMIDQSTSIDMDTVRV